MTYEVYYSDALGGWMYSITPNDGTEPLINGPWPTEEEATAQAEAWLDEWHSLETDDYYE